MIELRFVLNSVKLVNRWFYAKILDFFVQFLCESYKLFHDNLFIPKYLYFSFYNLYHLQTYYSFTIMLPIFNWYLHHHLLLQFFLIFYSLLPYYFLGIILLYLLFFIHQNTLPISPALWILNPKFIILFSTLLAPLNLFIEVILTITCYISYYYFYYLFISFTLVFIFTWKGLTILVLMFTRKFTYYP